MRLLILTQKIDKNDDVLGFFHRWVEEFAKQCEHVTVICLGKGEYSLPKNVDVLSLGKEEGVSKLAYIKRFYSYIWHERKNYDTVFVHMNPEYVVLGGLLWRLLGKRIGLWYTHKAVNVKLRIATLLAHVVFSASPESFRLRTKKVRTVGHGIDTNIFLPKPIPKKNNIFEVLTIGRISPVKDYETFINGIERVVRSNDRVRATIIGAPATTEQSAYMHKLKDNVEKKGLEHVINFVGSVPHKDILPYLQRADLFVNTSNTGSLDKAVLEAMACGVPVLTSNEGLASALGPYSSRSMFKRGDAESLSQKIRELFTMREDDRQNIGLQLRGLVTKNHNLSALIEKILQY